MDSPLERTARRVADLFADLAARPGRLFVVCLALNAVLLPYAGMISDARLYAAQVIQVGDGRYADDLFFKHGNQSRFTLFPELMAIPVDWLGAEPAFFAAYLVMNALRLWATQRLVIRLFGPTAAAAAALVVGAATPGWWGPTPTFAVNEWYFSARTPAIALAVLGLERTLAGRPLAAGGLLAVSAAIHPLITAPAAAVAVSWVAWGWATTPGRRAALAVVGTGGLVASVAYLIATSGTFDPEWRALVLAPNPYMDPRNWPTADLIRVAATGAAAVAVAVHRPGPAGCMLTLTAAAAAAGVLAGVGVNEAASAFPFQVQPFRAVWPLELVGLPAWFTLIGWLWGRGGSRRAAAVGLFTLVSVGPALLRPSGVAVLGGLAGYLVQPVPVVMAVALLGLGELVVRAAARRRPGGPPDRAWDAAVRLSAVAWVGSVLVLAVGSAAMMTELSGRLVIGDLLMWWHWMVGSLPVLAAAVACAAAVRWAGRPAAAACAAVGLALPFAAYHAGRTEPAGWLTPPQARDADFVRGVVAGRWHEPRTPTVYWCGSRIEQVWFQVAANSYFNPFQLAGNVFNRQNAVEGRRRWELVMRFEIDCARAGPGPRFSMVAPYLDDPVGFPPPTEADFRTLVSQPGLDFVVMPYDFGGAVASNGSVIVYDCRDIRACGR